MILDKNNITLERMECPITVSGFKTKVFYKNTHVTSFWRDIVIKESYPIVFNFFMISNTKNKTVYTNIFL